MHLGKRLLKVSELSVLVVNRVFKSRDLSGLVVDGRLELKFLSDAVNLDLAGLDCLMCGRCLHNKI